MAPNVVIAQSGGPSAAINSSLCGILDGCRDYPGRFGRVYGARHGIEGVLREDLLDLSAQSAADLELLRCTPAAGAIGTCRYKLGVAQTEDFDRILSVFQAHAIGYFFYVGGNDSMATADTVSRLAAARGLPLIVTGVPKTIDNDLGDAEFKLIDHTPGYGSTARYIAHYVQNAEEENRGSSPADPVLVVQVMGRHVGFIPAAARLADPQREMPLRIYMAESALSLPQIGDDVLACLRARGRCIVVVSEGVQIGDLGQVTDAFGHTEYGASRSSVAQVLTNYLNSLKFPVFGRARYQIPGTDQRSSATYASTVDLEEAYGVGHAAVDIARCEGTGWMATILRAQSGTYAVRYDQVPLGQMAHSERHFPAGWISASRSDVTDDFLRYARPLIGDDWPTIPLTQGLQRFARLSPVFAEKKLPPYVPQAQRAVP